MLSVLIPIYNFDVNQLVSDLLHQCQNENIEFEILCIDDCSSLDFKQKNIGLKKLQNINYTELKNNIGRAKIRELLAKNAQYSNLLFLDCDVEIPDNSFIANYLKNKDYNVVIGGIAYHEKPPSNEEFTLRWLYGSQREQLSVEKRKSAKFIHFLASNLWINRDIFLSIPIQINMHGYGHEDTWVGLQLFERNIKIEQIENPVFHIGLDTSEQFLEKSLSGIQNLVLLYKSGNAGNGVKLISVFDRLKQLGLLRITQWFISMKLTEIENNLNSNNPNLIKFDEWKLYHFIRFFRIG